MRPENLGFEDCDLIPYCRITDERSQTLNKDYNNCYRNPKKASKLPLPQDLDIDGQVVNPDSQNKVEKNSDSARETKTCGEYQQSSGQQCFSKDSSLRKSSENSCSLGNSAKFSTDYELKDKYPHYNKDENSTKSTSSAVILPSNRNRSNKCLKNKLNSSKDINKSSGPNKHKQSTKCGLPKTSDLKQPDSHETYSKDLGGKIKIKCSKDYSSDYKNSCNSYCPHSKKTKSSCQQNYCSECQKFYATILSNVLPHLIQEKSITKYAKKKQCFEDTCHKKKGEQLSSPEIKECDIYLKGKTCIKPSNYCKSDSGLNCSLEKTSSKEDLNQKKSVTKYVTTEKTDDEFGARQLSQPKRKRSFCRDANKDEDLEKYVLGENSSQTITESKSCHNFAYKDSRQELIEEHLKKTITKKDCDCNFKEYCKLQQKEDIDDTSINPSIWTNICEKKSTPKCPKWKQSFDDFCKEKEKERLSQLAKTSAHSKKYLENNKLESNTETKKKNSEKELNEPLEKKKSNKNNDSNGTFYKLNPCRQTTQKKCDCKNTNVSQKCKKTAIAPAISTDECEKIVVMNCPRKKESLEDFCKEKGKLTKFEETVCSKNNLRQYETRSDLKLKNQKHFYNLTRHIENRLVLENHLKNYKTKSGVNLWSPNRSEGALLLENQKVSIEQLDNFESRFSTSSSGSINLSASILLLKNQEWFLREYLEDSEKGSYLSLSNQSNLKQQTVYRESITEKEDEINNWSPKSINQSFSQASLLDELKFSQNAQKKIHSDNNIMCIIKRTDNHPGKLESNENLNMGKSNKSTFCDKWSQYLMLIQRESDEELCRQYDERLRQEEAYTDSNDKIFSSNQYISPYQADYLLCANSSNTSSKSVQNIPLKIEKEKLPSSIPVTGDSPLSLNKKENNICDNCLSMLLGNPNKSENKKSTISSFQSTMESESGTKKCFTNPLKKQTNSEPAADSEINNKKEYSTCKVTVNRLTTLKEDDEKYSLNKDDSTKNLPIPQNLAHKITSLDRENLKAFSEAHSQTMATIKYAMQDIADKVYKTTSQVASSAVTRIQSESARPIEIIKNYKQSEVSEFKKYNGENTENKLQILIRKINDSEQSGEPPFYQKIYEQVSDKVQSAVVLINDKVIEKMKPPNFNDESSKYDKVDPKFYDNKNSKCHAVSHVVDAHPTNDIVTFLKAKLWTLFTNADKNEETVSTPSDTSVSINANESETESDEDLINKLIE